MFYCNFVDFFDNFALFIYLIYSIKVKDGIQPINYSLNINFEKDEIKKAKATNWDCIKSPSIYLFYPIMIVVLVVVFILKCVKII